MKKALGWILIVFCSLFLALLLIYLLEILFDQEKYNRFSDFGSFVPGFAMFAILLILGLRNGLKKIKRKKEIIPFNETFNIELNGQISYKDYRSLILTLTYKKPFYLILLVVFILFFIQILLNFESINIKDNIYVYVFVGIFFVSPVFTLIQIKKLYTTSTLFHQPVTYKLTNEELFIKSATVEATQKWTNFYRTKETKGFFLFYTGKIVATMLDKKMFTSSEIKILQRFIKSLPIESD